MSPVSLAVGSDIKAVWALTGTLSTPLSIDKKGFLYSATRGKSLIVGGFASPLSLTHFAFAAKRQGDLPRAYRIEPRSGSLLWSTPLPPSVTLNAQVAQPAVADKGDLVYAVLALCLVARASCAQRNRDDDLSFFALAAVSIKQTSRICLHCARSTAGKCGISRWRKTRVSSLRR